MAGISHRTPEPVALTGASGPVAPVIDLREPHEVSAWARRLGCTEECLRRAVAAVGPEVDEVCSHLGTPMPLAH